MNKTEKLADLRHYLAHYDLPPDRPCIPLGLDEADKVLGAGLVPGALHEIHAADWGAGGFVACLAIRAAKSFLNGKGGPLFWVRPDYEALEFGGVSASGLAELGGDPAGLTLVRCRHAVDALAASADILACPHVGCLVLELSGNPKSLVLVARRRLAFTAAASGVTVLLLRANAAVTPSAAQTRWHVAAAPSAPGDDWGAPTFLAELTRNRQGGLGRWLLQWDCDDGYFRQAPHHGAVAAKTFNRPAVASGRRAV